MALRLAVVALCVLASVSTSALAQTTPPPPSLLAQELASAAVIEQMLYAAGLFNVTAGILNATGLSLALGASANLTLLAPSDEAWRNITSQPRGADLMQALKDHDGGIVLINTLLYHIIPEYYTSVTLLATTSDSPLPTLLGDSIFVSTAIGQTLFYSNITNKKDVTTDFAPDLFIDYVISIQGIDKVLIPKNISLLFTPVTLIANPAAPAPAGAPTAAPAPAPSAAPTAVPTAGSPPTSSTSRTPPSAIPSIPASGNSTSSSTTSSAGFVAINAVATFAALLVSVAALL